MNGWKAAYLLLIVLACLLFAIAYFTAERISSKGTILLLGVTILTYIGMLRFQYKRTIVNEKLRLKMEWIDWLNHRRHELLNELQVLYGYIKLNKPQSLLPRLEHMHAKLQQESIASRLNHPDLIWRLYRLISQNQKFEVEIEKEEGFRLEGKNCDFFARSIMKLIDHIEECADYDEQGETHFLTIHLDTHEDRLCCRLFYEGKYDIRQMESLVCSAKKQIIKKRSDLIVTYKLEDGYAFCEMTFPL